MTPMRVRKMDADGDMVFGGGQAAFWRDQPEGVAQNITTRLNLWTGQWFLDTSEGTPWRTKVLGKHTAATRDATLRSRIMKTAGVTGLASYSSTFAPDTRTFTVQARVNTQFGPATVTETL